jgi:hypothetical protein
MPAGGWLRRRVTGVAGATMSRSAPRQGIRRQQACAAVACWLALAAAWPPGAPASASPGSAPASAPALIGSGGEQAPERAIAGAVLMLPGAGLRADDEVHFEQPATGTTGRFDVVATHLVPHALFVRVPAAVVADLPVVVRVRSRADASSAPLVLNDARAHWFSPARVHARAPLASLPRQLRVVGRNLRTGAGDVRIRVRIRPAAAAASGSVLAPAAATGTASAVAARVVDFDLPTELPLGMHHVEVSADGGGWSAVGEQALTVIADPVPAAVAWPSACRADDGIDDTPCLLDAVATAARRGGGSVRLPAGVIDLLGGGADARHGVLLPPGVGLEGAGRTRTRIVRGAAWPAAPLLTVTGGNRIAHLAFEERAPAGEEAAAIRLGILSPGYPVPPVEDVHVFDTAFAFVERGIVASGAPVHGLVVTGNEFGARRDALLLDADRSRPMARFVVRDSIVRDNRFLPGGYVDCRIGQGTIASQVGASQRLDFSGNEADGRARDYLRPGERPGWRAAFFWHLLGPQDDVLVSGNHGSCTADKAGDGEFLAFDNNGNTTPFDGLARGVLAASGTEVEVPVADGGRSWHARWWGAEVADDFYVGHQLFVADGRGLGQVRTISAVARRGGSVRLRVRPDFDVVPDAGSRIVVSRAFNRLLVLGNAVDGRRCAGSNANGLLRGGAIGLWATSVDSVIAGNVQHDAGGILLQSQFDAGASEAFLQYHTQVADNVLDGEVAVRSACSTGGIQLHHSARTWQGDERPAWVPPVPIVQGYGVRVTGNRIRAADGLRGGSIVFADSWHRIDGARMYLGTLIDGNHVADVPRLPATPAVADPCRAGTCGSDAPLRGVAIHIPDAGVVGSVLDANLTPGVPRALFDRGAGTIVLER